MATVRPPWEDQAAVRGKRARLGLGLPLALALLLHAGLVAVRWPEAQHPPGAQVIELSLQSPAAVPPPRPPARDHGPSRPPVADAEIDRDVDRPEAGPPPAGRPAPPITTARLLDAARRIPLAPEPQAETLTLGSARSARWPEAMTREILRGMETVFEGRFLPGRQTVLDQWQEPGGARRVVLRTRDGTELCGEAEAWDPLNPLIEPTLRYRPCGGGGTRNRRPGGRLDG